MRHQIVHDLINFGKSIDLTPYTNCYFCMRSFKNNFEKMVDYIDWKKAYKLTFGKNTVVCCNECRKERSHKPLLSFLINVKKVS